MFTRCCWADVFIALTESIVASRNWRILSIRYCRAQSLDGDDVVVRDPSLEQALDDPDLLDHGRRGELFLFRASDGFTQFRITAQPESRPDVAMAYPSRSVLGLSALVPAAPAGPRAGGNV